MLRRLLPITAIGLFLLTLSPVWGALSLSGSTRLDTFNHDFESFHLKLEKLNTDWQLTPGAGNQLTIHRLRAKRLLVTLKENPNSTDNGLPDRIKLPLPIHVQQAEVAEVIVITKDTQYVLTNVKFNFDGNEKSLILKLHQAETPWGNATAAITLATSNPFAISGTAALKKSSAKVPYAVEAKVSGNLNTLLIDSESQLVLKDKQLALVQLDERASNSAAQLLTHIELGLSDNYPIKLTTTINKLQPERLGHYPNADLNVDFNLQGHLLPQSNLQLDFASRESQWKNQPFSSTGRLAINDTAIRDIDIQATLLDNQFSAKGSLNHLNSTLEWQLALPNLATFGANYAGKAYANGVVEGTFDQLASRLKVSAEELQITDKLRLEKLEGQATLMADDNGLFEGKFNATKLQYASNPIVDGNIHIEGSRKNHQIKLVANNQNLKLESRLKGGFITSSNWQGEVQSLAYQGEKSILLMAPAMLHVSSEALQLQHADLKLVDGQVLIERLEFNGSHFSSKGRLQTLSLSDLPPTFVSLSNKLQGDLTVSGIWNIQSTDTVNGELSFWRESGDLSFISENNKALLLGLSDAKMNASFKQNEVTLDINVAGKQLGHINTQLTTTLSKTDHGYALLTSAPLKLRSQAELLTLTWLPLPSALTGADIDGQLSFNVNADGSMQTPNLTGMLIGKNLQLSLLSEGVALTDGTIEASFDKDQLRINQALWKGGKGKLTTNGYIRLSQHHPEINLDWAAENFVALARTDRQLTLTGKGKTVLIDDVLTLTGNFSADKGFIQLAEEGTPKLGDDVIILGKVETTEADLKILLNGLRIDLGNDFTIRGQGIDAQLTGAVTLTGLSQYHPHTEGSIQITKGTYLAYGQVLFIEEGRFSFSGPLDNPGISLRAMRNSSPVNAGVQISGSAYTPVTKLISEPTVPDSDKLSWLVLGHGMDQAGGNEFAMLSLAAGAILSQGQSVPLQTQLARAAGLDEFSFSGGDSESTSLTLGRRLSSKLYLSYQKSINGLLDVARLTFNMTPSWSVRAESGTESAVDVLYTFSFE